MMSRSPPGYHTLTSGRGDTSINIHRRSHSDPPEDSCEKWRVSVTGLLQIHLILIVKKRISIQIAELGNFHPGQCLPIFTPPPSGFFSAAVKKRAVIARWSRLLFFSLALRLFPFYLYHAGQKSVSYFETWLNKGTYAYVHYSHRLRIICISFSRGPTSTLLPLMLLVCLFLRYR